MRITFILLLFCMCQLFSQSPAAAKTERKMVFVKGGTFMMGTEDTKDDEKPVHKVTLNDFYISNIEVTEDLWKSVVGELPCKSTGDNYAVYRVMWSDAISFCNKLSIKEGRTPCYTVEGNPDIDAAGVFSDPPVCDFSANGYRLPTEAEWEYAARGGQLSKGFQFSGSNDVDEVAWYKANADSYLQPAGSKKPNELGLYDMSGGVDEWCWDRYADDFYEKSPENNPVNRDGDFDVFRGGCVAYGKGNCYPTARMYYESQEYVYVIGLRLVTSK